jgi:CheY-like chemotaxis protein
VRVLVAESDAESAKKITEVLNRWNLAAEVVHDGGEALLWLHRNQPPAAVLGGHLRGLASPAIAEIVKRTAELRGTKLIRIAPIDEPVGAPEFEAERIVEPGELAIGLEAALEAIAVGDRPGASAPARPARAAASKPAGAPDPRVAAAERLARIIVSDIILYNQEKFQRAAAEGTVASALDAELMEASVLFRQRIPEEVRANRDFLVEELERRAKML